MPESRSLHLGCRQGWWPWRLRRGPPHTLPSLVFVSSPGQTLACGCIVAISASIFTWPSFLCVSVFESLLHSLTRIPVMGFGGHPKSQTLSSPQPYWIWRPCFQMRSHPKVPGEHGFWGPLFNPLHQTKTREPSPHKPESAREDTGFLISMTPQKGTLVQDTDTNSRAVPALCYSPFLSGSVSVTRKQGGTSGPWGTRWAGLDASCLLPLLGKPGCQYLGASGTHRKLGSVHSPNRKKATGPMGS